MIKITNVRGDVADTSSKTKSLGGEHQCICFSTGVFVEAVLTCLPPSVEVAVSNVELTAASVREATLEEHSGSIRSMARCKPLHLT